MADTTSYPPTTTTPEQQSHLLTTLKDFCISHGLTVRLPPKSGEELTTHAPISLYPALFPRTAWQAARDVQLDYNDVYAAIAHDDEWLGAVSRDLANVDDFIAGLLNVHEKVKNEGVAHKFSLGLFRSDYMLHQPTPTDAPAVLQVEFNTISSSFGALATRVNQLHRHLIKTGAYPPECAQQLTLERVPVNKALKGLAAGLALAHETYVAGLEVVDGKYVGSVGRERQTVAVLFVVQPGERNVFDQRHLEYALMENHGVRVYRISLDEVLTHTRIEEVGKDGRKRSLLYTPPHHTPAQEPVEISLIYFRAGYGPGDYTSAGAWAARLHLERSRAIKCPTVATQLAGTKKVQQLLAVPGVLERFLPTRPASIVAIRKTFAAIYPLDTSSAGLTSRKLAFETPEKFVLKPQREGGGNNVYREKIPAFLREVGEEKWGGYILMEMIETPPARGLMVREGRVLEGGVISELGVYGVAMWRSDNGEVVTNYDEGWLLRTKGVESEEGGVAAGFGCVDGIALVD